MKHLCFIIILIGSPLSLQAQMKTDGDNPKGIYKKFPYQFQFTPSVAFVEGDLGWFDFYLNDFMIDHTGRMWIAGDHGLSWSDDQGLNWHLSTSRYATFAIFETRKHTLLCSSTNEFVMRSVNHGQTWKTNKVKDVGSGRSSHGERYDDIFYVQVDDNRIIRTCQYNDELLITDDDGMTWKKNNAPDRPESIVNLGDTLLVMFTYDQMYTSTDRGDSWQQQSKGLPAKQNPQSGMYNGVIDCGVATSAGTIMALVSSQEEKVYNHTAYFFDLRSLQWSADSSGRTYEWGQSSIYDGGEGRLLTYNHTTWEMSVSFDKGKTWGVFYKADHNWAHPYAICPHGKDIYYIAYTEVLVMHFPKVDSAGSLPATRQTFHAVESEQETLELFRVKDVCEKDEQVYDEPAVSVYQLSTAKGPGYARFLLHVTRDTMISDIYVLHRGNDAASVVLTFPVDSLLQAGDYELWFYNRELAGCYFLNVVLQNSPAGELLGTTICFY